MIVIEIPDRWLKSLTGVQREAVEAVVILLKASYGDDTEREDLIDAVANTLRDMDDAAYWAGRETEEAA